MNEILKDRLRILADDEIMLEAIRQIVIEQIDKLRPNIDDTTDNMVLGEKFRAMEESHKLLNSVLQDISSYKGKRSSQQIINKGR